MAERTRANKGDGGSLAVPFPSKVALPARQSSIIRRDRLIEALSEIAARRVAVVTAQAGYGKTTLLVDFVSTLSEPVCWYSLDAGDADPQTFLRYFLAAGRAQLPGFGDGLDELLADGHDLTRDELMGALTSATASVDAPYTFVLDDFHFIDAAPELLQDALAEWVYRLPPGAHVFLSGRTRPPLNVLPMMSVRQEVLIVDSKDFAFTVDEVAALFRDVLGKEIALDDAQYLADLTEGWAGALILLGDRVQASRSVPQLEQLRPSDTLYQYLEREQFDGVPPEVREFLDGCGVPRTMDSAAVNELLDIADAEERLNNLVQRNLFIQPDPAGPHAYRFHRLFRAFLVSHLRVTSPDRFSQLHLRAASIAERAERWEEAVYHCIQALAWDRIVEITDKVGSRMFEEGQWDTLGEWLEAVPDEALASQPRLALWKARILYYLNQLDRALTLINSLIAELEARDDWVLLGEALVIRGMALRVRGDFRESDDVLSTARSLLTENGAPEGAITDARKELGITLGMSGDFAGALEELNAVLSIYESLGDTYNIAHVSDGVGNALMALGRLPEAINVLENARRLWVKLGNERRLAQTLNNLGSTYYMSGDLDNAAVTIETGLVTARRVLFQRAEVYLLWCKGDMQRDRGDLAGALETYREALEVGSTLDEAYIRIYLMDAVANTHRLNGDVATAQTWCNRAIAEAEARGGSFEMGLSLTTLGLIQRDAGNLKEAASTIERAVGLLEGGSAPRELAAAYFHLAGVYFSLKRKSLALNFIEKAAAKVHDLGYDHFLRVEAARNKLLVQYAAANKAGNGYFAALLKSLSGEAEAALPDEAAADSATGALRAFGFGHSRVEFNGREVTDLEWRSEKSKEMFFFFLSNRRPLRKEEIVAALWPDLADDKTTNTFHSNMYRLRKALYQDVIAKDSGRYVLDPHGKFVFDLDEYQQALQQADAAPGGSEEAITAMEKANTLYAGQFAPEFYSEWAENIRWQTEEQHTAMLGRLSEAYNAAGEYKKSADVCQRILDMDEFNEAAWYRLMSNYIQSGQAEAAKYCYNRYIQVISRDGDLEEGDIPDFDELVKEIGAARGR